MRWLATSRSPGATTALALVLGLATSLGACDDLLPRRSEGERIYRQRCAECHGLDASGNTPRFMGDVRADLLDDTWYSGGDEGSIVAVIHDGVPGRMPENTDLTAEQLQAVVRYVQALRHEHEAATTEQPF